MDKYEWWKYCLYPFGILLLACICVAGTENLAAAFGAANLPSNSSHPIVVKKKTPLDQPLEAILPINVNTTDAKTLMRVPGINRTAARQIVNHRDKTGKYTKIEQLKGFSGIGENNIDRLKVYLTVQ